MTKKELDDIRKQLAAQGVKDSDFPETTRITGDDYVAVVQEGVNKKINVNTFRSDLQNGPQGESAYEIAVRHGYTGTEEEWLHDPVDGIMGNGISSFELIGDFDPAPSANNTYRITPYVGDPFDFTVKNGVGLTSVDADESHADSGTSTYTMHFSDGTDQVILVKNGSGVASVEQVSASTEDGGDNVYAVITSDGRVFHMTIKNGTKGSAGSSVDYPFDLVDDLETDDNTKALSAKQGKVISDKFVELGNSKPRLIEGIGIAQSNGAVYESNNVQATPFIALVDGADLFVNGSLGGTVTPLALYDKDYVFIEAETLNAKTSRSWSYLNAAGAKYFRCSISNSQVSSGSWYVINAAVKDLLAGISSAKHSSIPYALMGLDGKKVSLLGDSNWVFNDESQRYGGNGKVVNDQRDTWWGRVLFMTGASLEVNASVGSSSVTDNSYYGRDGFLSRVDQLGEPDVVFIGGGMNEPPDVEVGEFDPEKPIGELDTLVFADAYDKMVRLIDSYYDTPQKVMVIHPKIRNAFKDVMREIAEYYGILLLDLTPVGSRVTYVDNIHYDRNGCNVVAEYMLRYLTSEYTGVNSTLREVPVLTELMGYVTSEVPGSGSIVKYITDARGTIIGTIDNTGGVAFTSRFTAADEEHSKLGSESDVIKAITDHRGSIIAFVDNLGKVHVPQLVTDNLEISGGGSGTVPDFLFPLIGIVASGTPNRNFVNDKTYSLLVSSPGQYNKQGALVSAEPSITLYDDDAIDNQLPTSRIPGATPETRPTSQVIGGYASVLFPLVHAFNAKYGEQINGKVTCFTAGEGQRIGLTPLYADTDDFDGTLNNNGQVLKRLIETGEWEVVCHSMTARYDNENYLVDGLDSEFANEVLANGAWAGTYRYNTTTCYDVATGKNYQIKQDKSGWTELPARYAKPYCAVSRATNAQIVINPTYSVKYQVDTWFNRADIAGLPYSMKKNGKRVYANWGSSHSVWHIKENLKYADFGFGGSAETNEIPFDTVVHRFNWEPKVEQNPGAIYAGYTGDFNLYTEAEFERLKNMIDACVSSKGWSFLGSHANTAPCANRYYSGLLEFVPAGETDPINLYDTQQVGDRLNYYDPDYPDEWTVPLQYDELQDIIGENTHDYLNVPPARLGISSWDEWYPRPGTGLAMLWDAMRYAVSCGVRFITAAEGFKEFGNLFTLGYKGPLFTQDAKLGNIPEENASHLIIGADGSIDYYSKN